MKFKILKVDWTLLTGCRYLGCIWNKQPAVQQKGNKLPPTMYIPLFLSGIHRHVKLIFFLSGYLAISTFCSAAIIDAESVFQSKIQPQIKIPAYYKKHYVKNEKEVYHALAKIHKAGGFAAIIFSNGLYVLPKTLNITVPNVMLLSKSTSPFKTILRGNGMKATESVDNLIRIAADNFILDGLTLEQSGNHLVQIAGENGANQPIIRNSILQNGYEQLIKVTYERKPKGKFSRAGIIENCLFQYTAGIGPNFYIGGIDAHGIRNWVIKDNIFANISSPNDHIAEHAIHLWNDTFENKIINNLIINSDRGIGLGMRQNKANYISHSNYAGIIQGNIIYHTANNHKFADVGIILEDSPETVIRDNFIYFEHDYPNAIEFRFTKTTGVLISNNITNRGIARRNNAQAIIIHNKIVELNQGDLLKAIEKQRE